MSHVCVVKRSPKRITPNEYKQCASLNLGEHGDMLKVLTANAKIVPGLYTYYLCKSGKTVLGWAILTRRLNGDFELDFFVRVDMRRKGYGKMLVDAIASDVDKDKLYAYPYDAAGKSFFLRNEIKIRKTWDGGDVEVVA